MTLLKDLSDNTKIVSGGVFKLFGVNRPDIMKTAEDSQSSVKMKKDFYDFMLVDIDVILSKSYVLINITIDSGNRGKIFSWIEDVESSFYVVAKTFKDYFSDSEIYLRE